jgi:hypothetical protein
MPTAQVHVERANGTAAEVVAAYRAGLSIDEVAHVFRMRPSLVTQLVSAAQVMRTPRRRTLRPVAAR